MPDRGVEYMASTSKPDRMTYCQQFKMSEPSYDQGLWDPLSPTTTLSMLLNTEFGRAPVSPDENDPYQQQIDLFDASPPPSFPVLPTYKPPDVDGRVQVISAAEFEPTSSASMISMQGVIDRKKMTYPTTILNNSLHHNLLPLETMLSLDHCPPFPGSGVLDCSPSWVSDGMRELLDNLPTLPQDFEIPEPISNSAAVDLQGHGHSQNSVVVGQLVSSPKYVAPRILTGELLTRIELQEIPKNLATTPLIPSRFGVVVDSTTPKPKGDATKMGGSQPSKLPHAGVVNRTCSRQDDDDGDNGEDFDYIFEDTPTAPGKKRKVLPKRRSQKQSEQAEHIIRERQRRDDMSYKISTLKSLLPPSSKRDRASIVDESVEYVRYLQERVEKLENMFADLKLKQTSSVKTSPAATPKKIIRSEDKILSVRADAAAAPTLNSKESSTVVEFHVQLQGARNSSKEVAASVEKGEFIHKCRCRPDYMSGLMKILHNLDLDLCHCSTTKMFDYTICSVFTKPRPASTQTQTTFPILAALKSDLSCES